MIVVEAPAVTQYRRLALVLSRSLRFLGSNRRAPANPRVKRKYRHREQTHASRYREEQLPRLRHLRSPPAHQSFAASTERNVY